MQRSSLYGTLALLLAIFVGFYSCTKRVNGINNNQVVETPYSLLFSDTAGALFNSTDGKTIQDNMFKPDGFPCRALCTSGPNILWIKGNMFISMNNGKNFSQAYDFTSNFPFNTCDDAKTMNLNQSMIIDIPDWNMAFATSDDPSSANYVGVTFNLNMHGKRDYWWLDIVDTVVPPATTAEIGDYGGAYPIRITTFALLKNGTLCGYDVLHNRNFYRTKTTLWKECTANPDSAVELVGSPYNRSGLRLPHRDVHYPASGLASGTDTLAWYSYGHINNRLIAIDNKNCNGNGAYFSDDLGRTWEHYTGLPNRPLLCVSAPFEEIALIGTDSAGLYVLNTNTGVWEVQTHNGLGTNIVIRNIAFKENVYKNGKHEKFIYLATNQGIYQSTDGGNNWVKTFPGNFVAVY
jgi:hypothetical protein